MCNIAESLRDFNRIFAEDLVADIFYFVVRVLYKGETIINLFSQKYKYLRTSARDKFLPRMYFLVEDFVALGATHSCADICIRPHYENICVRPRVVYDLPFGSVLPISFTNVTECIFPTCERWRVSPLISGKFCVHSSFLLIKIKKRNKNDLLVPEVCPLADFQQN